MTKTVASLFCFLNTWMYTDLEFSVYLVVKAGSNFTIASNEHLGSLTIEDGAMVTIDASDRYSINLDKLNIANTVSTN